MKKKLVHIYKGLGSFYIGAKVFATNGDIIQINGNIVENVSTGYTFEGLSEEATEMLKKDLIEQYIDDVELIDSFDEEETNNVDHPDYYNMHPAGIECIDVIRHYPFNVGCAIKYLWRAGLKKDASLSDKEKEIEDLKKAIWYIEDRINQLSN